MPRGIREHGPEDVEVWAKTEKFRARRLYRVDEAPAAPTVPERVRHLDDGARAIAGLLDDCHAERRHLIAHGKRWSFGGVVTCEDGVLETHGRLAQLIDATREVGGAPRRDVLWRALSDAARTREHVFVEAGVEIDALMEALDERGLAVVTAGSSSGQSLAGVINTASHGGDFELGPIPDMVRAIALVGPDAKVRWVEPAAGLVRDAAALATLSPSAELVRDDDAFDAALVTIGALGVIVAYVVEVRRAYGIWETVTELDWPTVRPMLAHDGAIFEAPAVWSSGAPLDPAARYRAVEVLINPFVDPDLHHRRVHVVRRAERDAITPGHEGWVRADWLERVRNTLTAIKTLIRTISEDVDDYGPGVDALLRSGREDTKGFAPAHRVLNYGNARVERVWSVDVVLPTAGDAHLRFLDEVLAGFDALIARNLKFAGFLALRFSRASRAALAMQSPDAGGDDVRFAQLELFLLQAPFDLDDLDLWREEELVQDGVRFYEEFCALAERYRTQGDLRVHWGQMMPSVRSFAPSAAALARWRRGRATLVGERPYLFANRMMLETGVVEPPAGFALDGILAAGRGDALERGHRLALAGAAPIAGPDGALYAVNGHGRVSRRAALGAWSPIRPEDAIDAGECPAGRLLAGRRRDGRTCLVSRDRERRLRSTRERRPGEWTDWDRVDRERVGEPALIATPAGLELFAVSGRGLERFREEGDDGWEQLDRVPASEDLVGAVALASIGGGTLVLARRADDALVVHRLGGGGWRVLGDASRREPALLGLGDRAIAVWLDAAGHVATRALDAAGAPLGATVRSADRPGLSSTGAFALSARQGGLRLSFADADRRVRVWDLDRDAAFVDATRSYPLDAVGGALVHGEALYVKVAHDIVVRRAL